MTIVEQGEQLYPLFAWALNITVTASAEDLEVSGVRITDDEQLDDVEPEDVPDILRTYRHDVARSRQGRGGKSRQWQFANAKTKDEQIEFVRKFGPVVVTTSKTEGREIRRPPSGLTTETIVHARQNLAELEKEQRIYRSAFELISELRKRTNANLKIIQETVSTIVEYSRSWPGQWAREQTLRARNEGYLEKPDWFFGPRNIHHLQHWKRYAMREPSGDPLRDEEILTPFVAGHSILCVLLNAFRPSVYLWGDTPVESPQTDLTGGIRPILYFILRREYLRQSGGIEICQNSDCRAVFEIDRYGQQYCKEECSRQQRQRDYWQRRGKKLRKKRQKTKKSEGKHLRAQ